jgi:broad specificity phosphatase PhoE
MPAPSRSRRGRPWYSSLMPRLFLVRHGLTTYIERGLYQGRTDAPLSETGRHQAARLGERLAAQPFDACYTSSLSRAQDTAALILAGRACPMQSRADLDEMSYGRWQGLSRLEIRTRYPDDWNRFMAEPTSHAPGGGENMVDLDRRVRRCRAELEQAFSGAEATVLVVAHGGSLRLLLAAYLDLDLAHARRLRLDNVCLSIVEVFEHEIMLSLFNDTAHLEPSKPAPAEPAH